MPIEPAQWLVPNRVIYAYAWGSITPEDLEQHNERMNTLIAEGIPLVHVILDSSPDYQMTNPSLKIGLDTLSFIRRTDFGFTAQVGTGNAAAKFGAIMLAKILRARYRMVDTVEEAVEQLKTYDTTVDWTQGDMDLIETIKNSVNNE